MKKILLLLAIVSLAVFGSSTVQASSTPNLKVQIFPLECSLDSVALGNVNSLQLTPENCLPGQPEPPTIIPFMTPSETQEEAKHSPSSYAPSGTLFLNSPMLHIPSSNFPISDIKGPLIIDPEEVSKEKTPSQVQANTAVVGTTILVTAGLLAVAHAVYTGAIVPLISGGTPPKLRFPWSKK